MTLTHSRVCTRAKAICAHTQSQQSPLDGNNNNNTFSDHTLPWIALGNSIIIVNRETVH